MKNKNKSDFKCAECNNYVSKILHNKGSELCNTCIKKHKIEKRKQKEIKLIESHGFIVNNITYIKERGTFSCSVTCEDCGRVKTTSSFRITKESRKCICKQCALSDDIITVLESREELNPRIPEEYKKVTGVYRIDIGNSFYIGSSLDIYARLKKHFRFLRKGEHTYKMMEAVLNSKKIMFSIIDTAESEEELRALEQKYIDMLKPDLNIDKTAKMCRRLDSNNVSTVSHTTLKKILFMLIETRDATKIAKELGVTISVVQGISCGKTYTWLKTEYPDEYKKAVIVGARLSYNNIRDILLHLVQEKTQQEIAKNMGIDISQVGLVKNIGRDYMKRLADTDYTISKLYEIIHTEEK